MYLGIFPVQFPDELQYFVDGLFGQDVVDEVTDEEDQRTSLFLLTRTTLRRVTLEFKTKSAWSFTAVRRELTM